MKITYCSQNNYELNAQSHAGFRLTLVSIWVLVIGNWSLFGNWDLEFGSYRIIMIDWNYVAAHDAG
jgi:hypothetical protein